MDSICGRHTWQSRCRQPSSVTQGLRPAQAADPLRVLVEVSQNFPGLAEPLSRLAVDEDLRTEVAANGRVVQVHSPVRTLSLNLTLTLILRHN